SRWHGRVPAPSRRQADQVALPAPDPEAAVPVHRPKRSVGGGAGSVDGAGQCRELRGREGAPRQDRARVRGRDARGLRADHGADPRSGRRHAPPGPRGPGAKEHDHQPKVLDGLRYLPRLLAERERLIKAKTPIRDAEAFLNCADCPVPREARPGYRCGWLPESEWVEDDGRPFPESTVCVGYASLLPEVQEAARMLTWANRNALPSRVGHQRLPAVPTECRDILDGAQKQVERDALHTAGEVDDVSR